MKIIKFSAMWCMSCIVMNGLIEKLLKDYVIEVIDYDYDIDSDKVREYGVKEVLPVLVFLDEKGREVRRTIGEVSKKDLIKIFDEVGVDKV